MGQVGAWEPCRGGGKGNSCKQGRGTCRVAFQKNHFGHPVEAGLEGDKLEAERPVRRHLNV